ncbi:DUF3540 domain-containing protein [Pseudenhygromyxa sp. WMMC2535]|uniref:DUF3540 domain-containing protein n=1 Tax=Pseudenhygromyxa sp. WMMC2535 TaxID=2712867 RepID=UPI0015552477|nr:DUF3540 domain-containing protein [Pseudenhygromyxa sp. WMMC2535]NVB39022.1 DUF3540 domain-containing protein [Pseudenhygromyxa sp. WMMC2535]
MHAQKIDPLSLASQDAASAGEGAAPRQGVAVVHARDARGWLLREAQDEARPGALSVAQRALSCLIEPELGDRVLFVAVGEERFVLAVLARAARAEGELEAPARIAVEGDLELRAGGRLRVGGEAVELAAERALAVRSEEFSVQARRGRVLFDALDTFVRRVHATLTESTIVGRALERFVERFTEHSHTSYRSVATVDHVRAGSIDYHAQTVAHVHGENTSMSAAELVKVDAGQIHLG